MRGADPDALWRPGFTGSWGYPIIAVPRARRRRWPWGVAAGAVLAATAIVVAGFVGGEAGSATGFPAAAEERWSLDVAGYEIGLVARHEGLVVLGDRHGGRLLGLDASDGARRWEGRLPNGFIADLQIADRAVLALVREVGGGQVLVALDPLDGGQRWAVPLGRAVLVAIGDAGIVVERLRGQDERGIELLDPGTGGVLVDVRGDDVTWTRSHVRRLEADHVELFDPSSLAPTRSIALRPLDLAGRTVDAVVVPGGAVVAAEERAVLLDEDGTVRDSLALEASGRTVPVHVHALDDAGALVAVQTGYRVTVLSVGPELRELWSESAWIVDWHVDARHQLVAVAGLYGSIVAFPPRILDAPSGRTRWDGAAEVQDASPLRVFGDGGFIGLTRAGGQGAVVGYDLDRVERWRRSLDNGERAVLVAGALITVDNGRGGATVTLSS